MLVVSHKQIGSIICDIIEEKLGIVLHRESVLQGCRLPDKTAKYLLKPHFKKYSFSFVLELIDSIEEDYLPEDEDRFKAFSLNLGIIIHYIADFFCYAHNNLMYCMFPIHMIYENFLAYKFSTIPLNSIIEASVMNFKYPNHFTDNYYKDYINKMHVEYKALPHSVINDIRFSIEACVGTACAIMAKCEAERYMVRNSSPLLIKDA